MISIYLSIYILWMVCMYVFIVYVDLRPFFLQNFRNLIYVNNATMMLVLLHDSLLCSAHVDSFTFSCVNWRFYYGLPPRPGNLNGTTHLDLHMHTVMDVNSSFTVICTRIHAFIEFKIHNCRYEMNLIDKSFYPNQQSYC